jgi:hypothetical protein
MNAGKGMSMMKNVADCMEEKAFQVSGTGGTSMDDYPGGQRRSATVGGTYKAIKDLLKQIGTNI